MTENHAAEWLTIAQAAARMQVSVKMIARAIHTRRLKALRLGLRRQWRIHVEWLQAWAEAEADASVVNRDAPGPALAGLPGKPPKTGL